MYNIRNEARHRLVGVSTAGGSNEAAVIVEGAKPSQPTFEHGRHKRCKEIDGGGRMGDNEQFRVLVTGSI